MTIAKIDIDLRDQINSSLTTASVISFVKVFFRHRHDAGFLFNIARMYVIVCFFFGVLIFNKYKLF